MNNKNINTKEIKRGDIYFAEIKTMTVSSIQGGRRPVVVVSNNMCNRYSPVIHIIPLTTSNNKKSIPTHVTVGTQCGLRMESIALAEQIQLVDKDCLTGQIGACDSNTLKAITSVTDIQLKEFDYEYVAELIQTISNINSMVRRMKEFNIPINTSDVKCSKRLSEQLKNYCEQHRMNYKMVVEEYKTNRFNNRVNVNSLNVAFA